MKDLYSNCHDGIGSVLLYHSAEQINFVDNVGKLFRNVSSRAVNAEKTDSVGKTHFLGMCGDGRGTMYNNNRSRLYMFTDVTHQHHRPNTGSLLQGDYLLRCLLQNL